MLAYFQQQTNKKGLKDCVEMKHSARKHSFPGQHVAVGRITADSCTESVIRALQGQPSSKNQNRSNIKVNSQESTQLSVKVTHRCSDNTFLLFKA